MLVGELSRESPAATKGIGRTMHEHYLSKLARIHVNKVARYEYTSSSEVRKAYRGSISLLIVTYARVK